MSQDKSLIESEYEAAKEQLDMAREDLHDILNEMIEVRLAKEIENGCGGGDNIIVVGSKFWLDQIRYYIYEDGIEFWGVDENVLDEEEKLYLNDFIDIIVFPPGEDMEWYFA